jgi:ABC-type branched-subunit amino acid transport system substrate-binding protein
MSSGAHAILGPASSGPTMSVQRVLRAFNVPQISYSASSPLLSDAVAYPTFLRTVASDQFASSAMAQFLSQDLEYTKACVARGTDAYSMGGAEAFVAAAVEFGMTILTQASFSEAPSEDEARFAISAVEKSGCRVVFLMSQGAAAGTVFRHAHNAGIAGEGSGYVRAPTPTCLPITLCTWINSSFATCFALARIARACLARALLARARLARARFAVAVTCGCSATRSLAQSLPCG